MNQEQVWDILAESWNNFRRKPMKYIEEFSKLTKSGKIIDLGCGNCRNLLPFENLEKYGTDFSSKMINQARKFAKSENFKVRLKKSNLTEISFKDNFFDYIICNASLHHLNKNDAEKTLSEIKRTLKPKGIALISVWNKWPRFIFNKKETSIPWRQDNKTYNRYYYLYNYFELKNLLRKYFKIKKNSKILSKNLIFLIQK